MQAVRLGNVCEILVNDETKKKREFGSCLLDWFIIGPCFFLGGQSISRGVIIG